VARGVEEGGRVPVPVPVGGATVPVGSFGDAVRVGKESVGCEVAVLAEVVVVLRVGVGEALEVREAHVEAVGEAVSIPDCVPQEALESGDLESTPLLLVLWDRVGRSVRDCVPLTLADAE
jgi:hypothetical protein